VDHHWSDCRLDHRETDEGLRLRIHHDMVVGLIGALIGGFVSSHLGFGGVGQHGLIISILIAVVGAVLLTWLVRLVSGNRAADL
jgi:uncharacterized membrane protein YeaQ/YmgE (transglycosylase-associated protein family)